MFLLLSFFMYAAEMSHVYEEMSTLEMEVEERTAILIPGLDPPPPPPAVSAPPPTTATTNTTRDTQQPTTRSSNISNPPRRNTMPNNSNRRCLIHLVMRCPVCFRAPHHRNPRILRQEGVRAILIRDVFGVHLSPRELALFIAGYYA